MADDNPPMSVVLAQFRDTCAAQTSGDIDRVLRWFGYTPGDGDDQFTAVISRAMSANHLAAVQLVSNVHRSLLVQRKHGKVSKEHLLVHSELACASVQWPALCPSTALLPYMVAAAFSRLDSTPDPFFTSYGMSTVVRVLATSSSPDDALRVEYKRACTAAVNSMLDWVRHTSIKNAGAV